MYKNTEMFTLATKQNNMVTSKMENLPLIFEENFLEHHAGQIIQDPMFASSN